MAELADNFRAMLWQQRRGEFRMGPAAFGLHRDDPSLLFVEQIGQITILRPAYYPSAAGGKASKSLFG